MEQESIFKKWWFWVVIVVIVFIFNSYTGSQNIPTQTTGQNNQPAVTENVLPIKNIFAGKQYQQIFTFSGNGVKKSEPFTITGDRFKIAYDCSGQLCQAFIYKISSGMPQVVMSNGGSIKDETIMYGSGEYYLHANSMGTYTMTVYDYK